MIKTEGRFRESCPRKLNSPPDQSTPCPVAMEALEKLDQGDKEGAANLCPWTVRDHSSGLCWWRMLDRESEPIESFKEIGKLLSEPEAKVKKDFDSAMDKIKSDRNTQEVKDFMDILVEHTKSAVDPDIYEAERMDLSNHEDESTAIIRGFSEGLVLHKGKRVQLHSLSKNHQKIMKEYNAANANNPEKQAKFSKNSLHAVEKKPSGKKKTKSKPS